MSSPTSSIEVDGVRGWLIPGDLQILEQHAARVPAGGRIVEIGSYLGLSASIMARNAPGAYVLCVDPWDDMINKCPGSFETFRRNTERYTNVAFCREKSTEVARLWPLLYVMAMIKRCSDADVARTRELLETSPSPFDPIDKNWLKPPQLDLLFIDGEHSECAQDLRAWVPLVKSGGVVLVHDCVPGEPPAVAVSEYLTRDTEVALVNLHCPPTAHYMAVLECRRA